MAFYIDGSEKLKRVKTPIIEEEELARIRFKLMKLLDYVPVEIVAKKFARFRRQTKIFHSKMYTRVSRRNSSTVEFSDPQSGERKYGFVLCCYSVELCHGENVKETLHVALIKRLSLQHDHIGPAKHVKVIQKPTSEGEDLFVPLSLIKRLCVWLDFGHTNFAFLANVPNMTHVV